MKASPAPEKVKSNPHGASYATIVAWESRLSLKSGIGVKILMAALFSLLVGISHLPATVLYTPVSFSYSVGTGDLGPGNTIFTTNLPGANDLVVASFSYVGVVTASNFYQLVCLNNGGFVATDISEGLYYAHSLNVAETWSKTANGWQWGADLSRMARTGDSSFGLRSNPTYIPFSFTDTTDSSTKYGYISLATSVTGSGASAQFNLDVFGYAYENSGAKIAMGAVPEPSIALSTVLGILGIVAALQFQRKER